MAFWSKKVEKVNIVNAPNGLMVVPLLCDPESCNAPESN